MGFRDLDAYRVALDFARITRPVVLRLRRSDDYLARQMHAAVVSIALNIAEGAGEYSPGDKARFYRYALRSCTEALASLDLAHCFGVAPDDEYRAALSRGERLLALLTRLVVATAARARSPPS
jgi:four helix bundle protein